MTRDIGESVIFSWLKHIEKCQLVQMNWKPSPNWSIGKIEEIDEMMGEIKKINNNELQDVFKKNNSDMFLATAECDAIGFSINNKKQCVYSVDVAFHSAGTNYSGNNNGNQTVDKVLSKIIRQTFCVYYYFGNDIDGKIIFMSPIMRSAIYNKLQKKLNSVKDYFKNKNIAYEIQVIVNNDFENTVLLPLMDINWKINNGDEYFLRSLKLLDVLSIWKERSDRYKIFNDMKVGEIAQKYIPLIVKAGIIENNLLFDGKYSKANFGLRFPLMSTKTGRRYYTKKVDNVGYICNHWVESENRYALMNWILRYIDCIDKKKSSNL